MNKESTNSMYNLIQSLNDKYLDLSVLLTEFDEALANKVTICTEYEDEEGRHHGKIDTYDEDGIEELRKIYDKLEKIVEGM